MKQEKTVSEVKGRLSFRVLALTVEEQHFEVTRQYQISGFV